MTQLGLREKHHFPGKYKKFNLVRVRGRIYGIPPHLDREEIILRGTLDSHPAVLAAFSLDELKARIDEFDPHRDDPELLGSYEGYDLVRHRSALYGVPQGAGRIDMDEEAERRRAGVITGDTCEELQERIRALQGTMPVEFAGWMPIYEMSGNCGAHPQFRHTANPPPGYRFTCSAPRRKYLPSPWVRKLRRRLVLAAASLLLLLRPLMGIFRGRTGFAPRARLRVLWAMIRLFFTLVRKGARLGPILRFLRSRHYQSQVQLANYRGLVFLTSMPYTYGQNPWIIEIEDPTTLFYPHIQNGGTLDLDFTASPYFPIVKTLLESDQCKGILTHMQSTARMVPTLFGSDKIREKVFYAPLGVELPRRWQRHAEQDDSEPINLLYINSWCQTNFYVRGGLDILEAFTILRERYPQLRLTMRANLPGLDNHYSKLIESGWVRVISRFLPAKEMDDLMAESHVFLLPAARVHVVSLLQAMSYGLAVVTSDGWGIDEYVTHERNGLIVKGRYGKVTWSDEQAGVLREDYEQMLVPDPEVVDGLVEAVSRLVEDRQLRRNLGRTARQDVQTNFSLEHWNQGLREVLERTQGSGGFDSFVDQQRAHPISSPLSPQSRRTQTPKTTDQLTPT
jgi:glycosyltransferase involved in cell wall biosynthesis